MGQGEPSTDRFEQIFREICNQTIEADGLMFAGDSIRAEQIKEEDEYQGIRLRLEAHLGNARIPIQIDIGFGDAITPSAVEIEYPTLLDFPALSLRAYPRQTVVAEKFQAMVMLGIANSRMKDFFDLWILAQQFEFDGPTICAAIGATFERRQTALPKSSPLALTPEFFEDRSKQTQWRAFLHKGQLVTQKIELADVVPLLEMFLMPPTSAVVASDDFAKRWSPGGPWTDA